MRNTASHHSTCVSIKVDLLFKSFHRYYEAVIDEITTDGQVSVTFANYKSLGVTTLGLLKLSSLSGGVAGPSSGGNKKELLAKQKEYLKKRKQKKQERFKKLVQVTLNYLRAKDLLRHIF